MGMYGLLPQIILAHVPYSATFTIMGMILIGGMQTEDIWHVWFFEVLQIEGALIHIEVTLAFLVAGV